MISHGSSDRAIADWLRAQPRLEGGPRLGELPDAIAAGAPVTDGQLSTWLNALNRCRRIAVKNMNDRRLERSYRVAWMRAGRLPKLGA